MSTPSKANQTTVGKPKHHEFTLLLDGVSEITDELADAIYRAGCDDALLGIENGKAYLDFSREADSPMNAIVSAVLAVENAGIPGLKVVGVRPPEAATIEKVNTLLESRGDFNRDILLQELHRLMGQGKAPRAS